MEMDTKIAKRYFSEAETFSKLTSEETYELLAKIRGGCDESFKKFIEANLFLVIKVIHQDFKFLMIPFLDAVNEGNIALMRAARGYDPEYGVKWSTYAATAIRREIYKALDKSAHPVRVPSTTYSKSLKIRAAKIKLEEALGREVTIEELAIELDIKTSVAKRRLNASRIFSSSMEGEEEEWGKQYGATDKESSLDREQIKHVLKILTDRERDIIERRFALSGGEKETLEEVSERHGVTRERVRQIEKEVLVKMRNYMEDNP
jgi:RNA polymerase primary sigma factor